MAAAQLETAHANDKARRKLELDLAACQGRELYLATAPGAEGVRRVTRRAVKGSLEELRAVAQNFTAQPKAVFIATPGRPSLGAAGGLGGCRHRRGKSPQSGPHRSRRPRRWKRAQKEEEKILATLTPEQIRTLIAFKPKGVNQTRTHTATLLKGVSEKVPS
jgi:hypothetical protein